MSATTVSSSDDLLPAAAHNAGRVIPFGEPADEDGGRAARFIQPSNSRKEGDSSVSM